jgi:hypothetical protein
MFGGFPFASRPFATSPTASVEGGFLAAWARSSNFLIGGMHWMKKNTASQVIGAQMVSASDGSAFTGAVTVSVTGDGGTQAAGSVGSGACTHEGNGFHTYAPAQAETNYDHIAFTFTGTGAIPATLQVYPTFPQTGDNFARIGAPVGASISADVAAVKTQTAAIETDTQDIQSRLPAALVSGRIDASVGAMAANVMTAAAAAADLTTELQSGLATQASVDAIDDLVDTEVAAIKTVVDAVKAVTDALPDAGALTSLATQASVNTIDDFLDTEIAAIKAKTDNLPSDPADASDIATATTAIAGYIDTEVAAILAAVDTEVAAIKAKTDQLTFTVANKVDANATHLSGSSTAADNLEAGATGLVPSTCAAGSTTTSVVTNLTEATDDHYNGRVITFTSGALLGQSTNITDYNGTTKALTVTALTEAPADTDAFVIS